MPLTRTALGLLARHRSDDATIPFALADWVSSGPVLSLVSGRLRAAPSGGGTNLSTIRHALVASRAKVLLIMRARGDDEANLGPAAHINDITEGSDDLVCVSGTISRAAGELFVMRERENGVNAPVQSTAVAAKAVGTEYTFRLFANGTAIRGRDDAAAFEQDLVASLNVSGQVGLSIVNTLGRGMEVSVFYAMADRYVTVTGVPAGGSAEVQTSAGAVLASAVGVGGTATIDVFTITFSTAARVVVKDSGGAVLDLIAPANGVWGGDTYLYEPAPTNQAPGAPVVTAPVATEYDEAIAVAWNAAVDPDGDPLQYEGDYWDGVAWRVLFPLQAGLAFAWDTSALEERADYQVRVRAWDGALYGPYGYSGIFSIDHFFPWVACPPAPATTWEACEESGPATYEEAVLEDQPWAYYRLKETTATPPQDSSGNARHGHALDTTFMALDEESPLGSADPEDRGVVLTGSGLAQNPAPIRLSALLTPGVGGLDDTPPTICATSQTRAAFAGLPSPRSFSVEFWYRPEEPLGFPLQDLLDDELARVLWMATHGGDQVDLERANFAGMGINVGTNGIAIWGWAHNFTQQFNFWRCTPNLAWRHCVIVVTQTRHDGTGTAADLFTRIYVDGVYAGSRVDMVEIRDESWAGTTGGQGLKDVLFLTGTMGINSAAGTGSGELEASGFRGGLDEVAIYDYALSPERIAAHYEARTGLSPEGQWQACAEPAATPWSQC